MSNGDLSTIQKIRDQGGELTILVQTAHRGKLTWCLVTLAAYYGHTHLLLPLLNAGLSVEGVHLGKIGLFEIETTTTWTPLMVAARQGHVSMIKELLFYHANPLARDDEGNLVFDISY